MIPNISTSEKMKTSDSIVTNRAYTFLDSYIYLKNTNYRNQYEKNKKILAIEKNALEAKSCDILYYAAVEQTKSLSNMIVSMKEFAVNTRHDVNENMEIILPDSSKISEFEEAINSTMIPKQTIVKYKISHIAYPNMITFIALLDREIKEFAKINPEQTDKNNPLAISAATKYLINTLNEKAKSGLEILEQESFKIVSKPALIEIKQYLSRRPFILNNINKDFRTYYIFLRQFRALNSIIKLIKPTVMVTGEIELKTPGCRLRSFSDYLMLYKHYCTIIKYLMDMVSYFDTKFFNKIYSLQSNIEVYTSVINNSISYYKTHMRNTNESFSGDGALNGIVPMINGPEIANMMMLNDSEKEIEPLDIGDMEKDNYEIINPIDDGNDGEADDVDGIIQKIYNRFYNKNVVGEIPKAYCNSYDTVTSKIDESENMINKFYENVSPIELLNNKQSILNEADEVQGSYKDILKDIDSAIHEATARFKSAADTIKLNNAAALEDSDFIEISGIDTSGIEFEMFNYRKGVEVMHKIRIPSFQYDDMSLLLEGGALGYKQKYFKDIYYFSQNGCPLNTNRFRGSQAKKVVENKDIEDVFNWFKDYIDNYSKVISAVTVANGRIQKCIKDILGESDSAYGGNDKTKVESIILNRTQFRDDIYKILLEADGGWVDEFADNGDSQQPQQQQQGQPIGQDQPQQPQQQNQNDGFVDEFADNGDSQQQADLNIDDNAASDANDADNRIKAARVYCKIAYEINSKRMDIYEEIYETAFKFITLIVAATNGNTVDMRTDEQKEEDEKDSKENTNKENDNTEDQSNENNAEDNNSDNSGFVDEFA